LTATLGAGVLTMPSAFRASGLGLSFIQLIIAALISYTSIAALVKNIFLIITYHARLKLN
jgi:amino acid permease